MNLPWFGSLTEATEPRQMGGSESLVFRFFGCPNYRSRSMIFRSNQARLCRMGTRRRQLAHGRFHVFDRSIRRCVFLSHFHAVRISSRRMKSVVHFHAVQNQFRRFNFFLRNRGFARGFRRFPSVVHGFSSLLRCLRRGAAVCREEVPHLLWIPPTHPHRAEALSRFAGGTAGVALSGPFRKAGTIRIGIL